MRSLHLGITFGLLAAVTTVSGCGRSDANRSTDTALTTPAAGVPTDSPPAAAGPGAPAATTPPATTPAATTPAATTPAAPAAPAAPSTSGATTGRVVEVQMLGDATGYRFAPTTITIKRGDRVRWTMVSGAPHNVAFWPDSIPAGAATKLGANMPKTMAPLTGPLLMTANETYEMSFDGVPAGSYKYFCTPHLALGMTAVVRVQ